MSPLLQSLAAAGVAAVLAVMLTPAARRLARQAGAVAHPKADRWHRRTVPTLGGIAIVAATIITVVAFEHSESRTVLPVLLGGVSMFALGLVDDLVKLKPSAKLTAQIAIACLVVMVGAVPALTGWEATDSLLAILWIVAITNAFNLLDNMDGLCAGVAAIAAFACCMDLLDAPIALPLYAAALAGASVGFLVFNFTPASIFMGDAGSLFLGVSLAVLALMGGSKAGTGLFSAVAVPAFILLIPIFDTTFVTLSRILSARPPAQGGRDHTSHRLVAMGFSEAEAVVILWGLAAAGGAAAVLARRSALSDALLLGPLVLIALALLGIQLARVRVYHGDDFSLLMRKAYTPLLIDVTYKRRIFEVLLDLFLVTFSYYAAYVIRFDRDSVLYSELFVQSLPIIIACQLGSFFVAGVYRGSWRYIGLEDLTTYAKGIALGLLSSVIVLVYLYRFEGYSRGVFLIDAMLLALLLVGSRLSFRVIGEAAGRHRRTGQTALIYGAGAAGALVLREFRTNAHYNLHPIAFLDDDPAKKGKHLRGLPILGGSDHLESAIAELRPQAIIVSTQNLEPDLRSRLEDVCYRSGTALLAFRISLDDLSLPRMTVDE